MSAVTKQDVEQSIESAVSKLATKTELSEAVSKLATKYELAEAVSKLATKYELAEAVSKLATKDELADAVSKLATKDELAEVARKIDTVRDELLDHIHLGRILAEDTNKTVQLMYELLLPKAEKVDHIDPLERRIERCEEQVDVLNLAVKSHVTDKKLHPQKP